jgi:hypothetical protein
MILLCDCCQREIDTLSDDFHIHDAPAFIPSSIRRHYDSDVFCESCEELVMEKKKAADETQ